MNRKSIAVMNWRNRTKLKLVEYKGGKCQRCGYDKLIPSVFEFHHRNSEEKDFTIGGKSWSYERLKKEVDKCDMLCRNCHAETHDELIQESRQLRMEAVKKKVVTKRKCPQCKKEFTPPGNKYKFCSVSCVRLFQRKAERPSKAKLKREIQEIGNWCAIGRKYKVSDNAVRKWARQYGLI